MKAIGVVCLLVPLLGGCLFASVPPPEPLRLKPPAPPAAEAGEIRVFGANLPLERARHLRARIRKTEPRIVRAYEAVLAGDAHASGRLQIRIDVNREGEVADVERIVDDLNNPLIEDRIADLVRGLRFDPGPEAYVFYAMAFEPDPFEILGVRPELDADPPTLAADVVNRSAFRLRDIAVTVRVQRPDRAEPLRISRRRIRAEFEPLGRRTIRVPLGTEWASERYTFLVDVRPDLEAE